MRECPNPDCKTINPTSFYYRYRCRTRILEPEAAEEAE